MKYMKINNNFKYITDIHVFVLGGTGDMHTFVSALRAPYLQGSRGMEFPSHSLDFCGNS